LANRETRALRAPLRFGARPVTLMSMSVAGLPQIPAADLARRLEGGEPVQVLDIRSPERVAQGRVTFGATLDFRAFAASEIYRLPSLAPLRLQRTPPAAVPRAHG